MINGATCDPAYTTGCGQTPATVTTGSNPWGIAVDGQSHVYVADTGNRRMVALKF